MQMQMRVAWRGVHGVARLNEQLEPRPISPYISPMSPHISPHLPISARRLDEQLELVLDADEQVEVRVPPGRYREI